MKTISLFGVLLLLTLTLSLYAQTAPEVRFDFDKLPAIVAGVDGGVMVSVNITAVRRNVIVKGLVARIMSGDYRGLSNCRWEITNEHGSTFALNQIATPSFGVLATPFTSSVSISQGTSWNFKLKCQTESGVPETYVWDLSDSDRYIFDWQSADPAVVIGGQDPISAVVVVLPLMQIFVDGQSPHFVMQVIGISERWYRIDSSTNL